MHVNRLTGELVLAAVTGAIGAVAAYGSQELGTAWTESGPEPGYFPFYIGAMLLAASAWNFVAAIVRRRPDDEAFLQSEQAVRLARYLVPLVLFVLLSIFMGLYVGTAVYLFYVAWREGGYAWWKAAAIAVGFVLALYGVFELAFQVPLHKGPIEDALGIY